LIGIPTVVVYYLLRVNEESNRFTPLGAVFTYNVFFCVGVIYPLVLVYKRNKREWSSPSATDSTEVYKEQTELIEMETGFSNFPHIAKLLRYPGDELHHFIFC
jgi:hypothetical protein